MRVKMARALNVPSRASILSFSLKTKVDILKAVSFVASTGSPGSMRAV